MTASFVSLLFKTCLDHPETGVPLALAAFREGKLDPANSPQEKHFLEQLVSEATSAISWAPSQLFLQLFAVTTPDEWRQAMGTGLEDLGHLVEGVPLPRFALNHWSASQSSSKPSPQVLDRWFMGWEGPIHPQPNEAPGTLLGQALAYGLEDFGHRLMNTHSPLALTEEGEPAIASVRHASHWERFKAQKPDLWAAVGPSSEPLILLVQRKASGSGLGRQIKNEALLELSQTEHASPAARGWAHKQLTQKVQNKTQLDTEQWMALLRAAGPALVVQHASWKKIGERLGQPGWYDALEADPVFIAAIGRNQLEEARYELIFRRLGAPVVMVKQGPDGFHTSTDIAIKTLRTQMKKSTLPVRADGLPWVRWMELPFLEPRQNQELNELMASHSKAWWGSDPEQTDVFLFQTLGKTVANGKKSGWKKQLETLVAIIGSQDQRPWLQTTEALAKAMILPQGKQYVDAKILLEVGLQQLAIHETQKTAFDQILGALDRATRQTIQAGIRGLELDRKWETAGVNPKSRPRL